MDVHVVSASVEDSAVQTSAGEPSAVEFVAAPVAAEATMITIPEVSAMTSMLMEPVIGFVSEPNEMTPVFTGIVRTIIERRSGSAPTELAPAMDIMEELAHHMVQ